MHSQNQYRGPGAVRTSLTILLKLSAARYDLLRGPLSLYIVLLASVGAPPWRNLPRGHDGRFGGAFLQARGERGAGGARCSLRKD